LGEKPTSWLGGDALRQFAKIIIFPGTNEHCAEFICTKVRELVIFNRRRRYFGSGRIEATSRLVCVGLPQVGEPPATDSDKIIL
jgi:hypothetical protein